MANQNDILRALSTKEEATGPASLAPELRSDEATVRTNLNRLKGKGYVSGGGSQWYITDAGKTALERGEEAVTTKEDVGEDEISKFRYYGRLSGVKDDLITACIELFQNTDMRSMEEMERILAEMNVPQTQRIQWTNLYRGYLRNTTAPEKREELYPLPAPEEITAGEEKSDAPSKRGGRDYVIVDDEPVRVGENLGDYSLQDAKDILGIRALRRRFSGVDQSGGSPSGAAEKVSDVLTALSPYLNKGSDLDTIKEVLADKLALQRQEILNHIPQGPPSQPKSFIEQITEAITAITGLKEVGPTLRSILGIPESSGGNPNHGLPVQIKGPDGQPIVMDLGQVIDWRRFQGEERRADERQTELAKTAQTVRENLPDAVQAIITAAQEAKEERKTGTGEKSPPASQRFKCGECGTQFSAPAGWAGQNLQCPSCGREYTKEELA